jgi:tetratricopeptide (TPR) repeat protein
LLISKSQPDQRHCPKCHALVISELWLIVHRHERPKLWEKAESLRTLTCPNGHRGVIHGPLLMFDPASPVLLFSPSGDEFSPQSDAEGDLLMTMLWESLPSDLKAKKLKVEMVPFKLLPVILQHPRWNLGDLAPGTPESEEALKICEDIRSGNCSSDQLRAWTADGHLHPALRAGIQFELASYLSRMGLNNPKFIEEAIPQWKQVLRLYPRTADARRWAICNLELASCFANRREANPAANLREAIRLLDLALEVLTADSYPEDFALAQARKANLLLDMGNSSDLVARSLAAFEAALSVYTKESYPDDWCLGLSNMATAYLTRGGYKGVGDLNRAIDLMEQVVKVRTRETAPESWAITQMNLGLALSRLPTTDFNNSRQRAISALRGAHEVFTEGDKSERRFAAAYNLGLTLARFGDPATSEEATDRLEEALPWLRETRQAEQATDALDFLSKTYVLWLHNTTDTKQGDLICRRALYSLRIGKTNANAVRAIFQIGIWLLQHAKANPDRLALAEESFELVIGNLQAIQDAELRAAAFANLATVRLLDEHGVAELNGVRARENLNKALQILRALPSTPELEERIGLILMNLMQVGR